MRRLVIVCLTMVLAAVSFAADYLPEFGWLAEPMSASGDTVRTEGTVVYAYSRHGCFVNGVSFAGIGDDNLQDVRDRVRFSFDTDMNRDMNQDGVSEYSRFLDHYWASVETGDRTLRLDGLTWGKTYLVQLVLNMQQDFAAGVQATAPGGETARANGEGWGYGGSLVGVFRADGASETFTIRYEGYTVLTAIQVREIPFAVEPPPMARLTVPAVRHARPQCVAYGGRKARPAGGNDWLVPTGSVVTVTFAADTGYELEGNPVRVHVGASDGLTLSSFPSVKAIAFPDDKVSMKVVDDYALWIDGCGGIAYAGTNGLFYLLQDHAEDELARVSAVTLKINPETAAITGMKPGCEFTPGSNTDSEGIAYDAAAGTLWISDESEPTIAEFGLDGMRTVRSVLIPRIQKTMKRPNNSLESLTISPDGLTMWSANEQALFCDGDWSGDDCTVETVVRILKFTRASPDDDWSPAGQWAYTCDATQGTSHSQCGVSGLCALPDGSLLVLEREVSTSTWGRCRIYRVTPFALSKATDVTSIPALSDAAYTGVHKGKPLVDFHGTQMKKMIVYEGIALGPKLNDGSWSIYLVSDGGAQMKAAIFTAKTVSRICALRLFGVK